MNYLKKIKFVSLCFLILFLFANTNVIAQQINQIIAEIVQYKIFLNGKELFFKQPIVTINDRTYVPLREFAEDYLDMNVGWYSTKEEVSLYGKIDKIDEPIIRVIIHPAASDGLAYRIDLLADGQLSSSVGDTEIFVKDYFDKKSFTPKITRYKYLTDVETKYLTELISQITVGEEDDGMLWTGGWYVAVIYQNQVRRYGFTKSKGSWLGNEHMFDIIEKLIEYSPIEVVAFNYEDRDKVNYYNNYDW